MHSCTALQKAKEKKNVIALVSASVILRLGLPLRLSRSLLTSAGEELRRGGGGGEAGDGKRRHSPLCTTPPPLHPPSTPAAVNLAPSPSKHLPSLTPSHNPRLPFCVFSASRLARFCTPTSRRAASLASCRLPPTTPLFFPLLGTAETRESAPD